MIIYVSVLVELDVSLNCRKLNEKFDKPSWGKVSFKELLTCSKETIDWNYSCQDNTQDMWNELHSKLTAVASIVPATPVYRNNRPVKLPWDSSALKRMRKNKDKFLMLIHPMLIFVLLILSKEFLKVRK